MSNTNTAEFLFARLAAETKAARQGQFPWHAVFATKAELEAQLTADRHAAHPGVADRVAARRAARNADRKF